MNFLEIVFSTLDTYLKLILSSWPAVVLILGIIVLHRHKDSLDDFFKNIKSLGPKGLETHSPGGVQEEGEDEVQKLRKTIDEKEGALKIEAKNRWFERVYGFLYGGQLTILKRLTQRSMIPYSEATEIYNEVVKRYPQLASYNVHEYIAFLKEKAGLIDYHHIDNTDFLTLTSLGKEFMEFVQSENLSLVKTF